MVAPIRLLLPLALIAALAGCGREDAPATPAPAPAPAPAPEAAPVAAAPAAAPAAFDPIAAVLEGEHRSEANRARDAWRHPAQTLAFFGFAPDATVIEITPGGGWYTELLAPAMQGRGTLVAAVIDPASASNERAQEYYTRGNQAFRDKLAESSKLYGDVRVHEFSASQPSFGEAGSADLVLTFRNVHNWVGSGAAPAMFQGFFDVLKPGGTLGVVEHRAPADSAAAGNPDSGYMTEDAVIALATAAGFELAERSEINANPADTRDHPNGVWTLPPSSRVPEGEDGAKYLAIGESDRMTLKFTKPQGDAIKSTSMD